MPAALRAVLAGHGSLEMVGRKSDHGPSIEMWPKSVFEAEVQRRVAALDPFGEDYDDVAADLVAEAHALAIDNEGRVVLPRELIDHAALAGEIAFSGRVSFFQVWDRARLRAALAAKAAAKAATRRGPGAAAQAEGGRA